MSVMKDMLHQILCHIKPSSCVSVSQQTELSFKQEPGSLQQHVSLQRTDNIGQRALTLIYPEGLHWVAESLTIDP